MDRKLYTQIRKIADLAYDYFTSEPAVSVPWLEDRRYQGINPFYHQTKDGVFLELYYGAPGKLYTPLGEWDCWGSSGGWCDKEVELMLQRLGAEEYIPLQKSSWGEYGPVYRLTRIDDEPLPYAEMRNRADYLPREEAKRQWAALQERS